MSRTRDLAAEAPRRPADEDLQCARLLLLQTELELCREAVAGRTPTPGQASRARWFERERARLAAALRRRDASLPAAA